MREREILERAVRAVAEQPTKADALVDKALEAGLDGSHPLTVHAKMLRLELLRDWCPNGRHAAGSRHEVPHSKAPWLTPRSQLPADN